MNYLAIDLGAGSGRVIVASYDGSTFELDVVHRFPTPPCTAATRCSARTRE